MNSALYSGWIAHRRFSPRAHQFRYRIGLLYLDLDEQQAVFGLSRLSGSEPLRSVFVSRNRLPEVFHRPRHTPDRRRATTGRRGHRACAARLDLPADPAPQLGLSFNPVSFFYCHEADGQLAAIVCEVSNTPWRERYHYVLPAKAPEDLSDFHQHFSVPKAFHVSPFLPRDIQYRMSFSPVAKRIGVHMADWQGEEKLFDATLRLKREPLDRASLHR